jgi:hypothetical protein
VSIGFHLDSKEPDWSKFRDLATPTLLHFGNAQASLSLRSTSAVPIIGEVRYNSLTKTFPRRPKNSSSPRKEMQNSVMKVIKSFPNFNSFAFLRALPKAVNTAEIKSNAVNNAKLRYEGYKKLSEM